MSPTKQSRSIIWRGRKSAKCIEICNEAAGVASLHGADECLGDEEMEDCSALSRRRGHRVAAENVRHDAEHCLATHGMRQRNNVSVQLAEACAARGVCRRMSVTMPSTARSVRGPHGMRRDAQHDERLTDVRIAHESKTVERCFWFNRSPRGRRTKPPSVAKTATERGM